MVDVLLFDGCKYSPSFPMWQGFSKKNFYFLQITFEYAFAMLRDSVPMARHRAWQYAAGSPFPVFSVAFGFSMRSGVADMAAI